MKLNRGFYEREDVVQVAKELIGKRLFTRIDGDITVGIITEVEAYSGRNDKACHANDGLRTKRTEVMYGQGGMAYVYLCYGIHQMFNVVTNKEGLADAVLVRAIQPIKGSNIMLSRRKKDKIDYKLSSGPGILTQALGITVVDHNTLDLLGDNIWIEAGEKVSDEDIVATTRIGIDYAEEDALKPWRFYLKESKWISKK